MRTCWARVLGGCGGGFSGEHIVSKGLFRGNKVHVAGTPWTTGAPKAIGINSLTANMLCRNHNSALSPVDEEGILAFHAIHRFEEILSGRQVPENGIGLSHVARGPLMERWFVKHAINFFVVAAPSGHWNDGSKADAPPVLP